MKAHIFISCSCINMRVRAARGGVAKKSETALVAGWWCSDLFGKGILSFFM